MKDTILLDRPQQGLARIRLNKPEVGNAYDDELVCAMVTALDDISEDDQIKLLWLTAAGNNFCVGPDDSWRHRRFEATRAEHQQDAEQLSRLFQTLYQLPFPSLATVRGSANAAAVGMLCCCDIVLGSERSNFTITETDYGQVPALQSPYLVKTLGERAARYYALTSEPMDAYTATRLGLLSKIVPINELDSVADVMIQRILKKPNHSLQQSKAMLHLSSNEAFDDSLIETLLDCSIDIRVSLNHEYSL